MGKSSSFSHRAVKVDAKQMEELLDVLAPNIEQIIREGVNEHVGDAARFMLQVYMNAEARALCGRRYSRSSERKNVRWGNEQGKALIDGVKRAVSRPRIRVHRHMNDREGGEIQLETYKAMNRGELLDGPLVATILAGVSARAYETIVSRRLEAQGVKSSAISRKAIAATRSTVEQFRKRRLDVHDLVVLLFDGICVGKRQMIACIGVDINGRKHVLALRLGATENETVCRDLIRDMIERGLNAEKRYLFVIDGSKALVSAIHAAFGQDAAIQRCQEHKIRDVQAYVPVKFRSELRDLMQAAYNQKSEKQAYKRLEKIRSWISLISQSAANALTEGMRETLTLHRLGVTGLLRKSLRTTNIMESAFSSVRRHLGRVTNFQDEAQRDLWVIRSLVEAEKHFRGLKGYRQLRKLKEQLDLLGKRGDRNA